MRQKRLKDNEYWEPMACITSQEFRGGGSRKNRRSWVSKGNHNLATVGAMDHSGLHGPPMVAPILQALLFFSRLFNSCMVFKIRCSDFCDALSSYSSVIIYLTFIIHYLRELKNRQRLSEVPRLLGVDWKIINWGCQNKHFFSSLFFSFSNSLDYIFLEILVLLFWTCVNSFPNLDVVKPNRCC